MKIRFLVLAVVLFYVSSFYAQSSLDGYKYIIVPNKFDFLSEKNKYQLNGLTHFLFNKNGFKAIIEGEDYPKDLINNRCLALRSNVLREPGMFKTKLKLEFKDCNDKVVYVSPVGESREKEYKKAYHAAIRTVFEHLKKLNYSFKPSNSLTLTTEAYSEPIDAIKSDESVKPEQQIQEVKSKVENRSKVSKPKHDESDKLKKSTSRLYAQPIENGFQLVDTSPKVLYRIKNTGLTDVFLVEHLNGVIYKKAGDWILEYYDGETLVKQVLDLKF
ncbi:hypothetical protein [Seonamhaeicola sp. ML3]|uniref:hypothetical protein n=1 Tax=Seonamhaeicola sp. ML3 TaxID=2937786 RepID=UPI00200D0627|nr:hypothetical protein [Seonamhaeicola sp. ML3]